MKRVLWFGIVAWLAGCPVSTPLAGEVSFGLFEVHGTLVEDTCQFGEEDIRLGDLDFVAHFGADSDLTAYMVVQLPNAPAQKPVEGRILDGRFEFVGSQLQEIQTCDCVARTEEMFDIGLAVDGASDGGTSDGGVGDGGLPDAGTPDGGSQDGGAGDGGVVEGPIAGLPVPESVTSMEGTLLYTMTDPGSCTNATCTLPCTFSFTLAGPRVE